MPLQCGEGTVPSVSRVTSERPAGLRPCLYAEDIQDSDESRYPGSSLNPSKASGDGHNRATSYHSKKTSAHYDKRGHGTYAMRAVNVLLEPGGLRVALLSDVDSDIQGDRAGRFGQLGANALFTMVKGNPCPLFMDRMMDRHNLKILPSCNFVGRL